MIEKLPNQKALDKIANDILDELFRKEQLIAKFYKAEESYRKASERIGKYFDKEIGELVDEFNTKPDAPYEEYLRQVRGIFTGMPDCVERVLLKDKYREFFKHGTNGDK